jgi:hypothetical protein
MTAALSTSIAPTAINSNHPGMEYGVVMFDPTLCHQSLDETRSLLELDGWSKVEPAIDLAGGVQTFLVSRKK